MTAPTSYPQERGVWRRSTPRPVDAVSRHWTPLRSTPVAVASHVLVLGGLGYIPTCHVRKVWDMNMRWKLWETSLHYKSLVTMYLLILTCIKAKTLLFIQYYINRWQFIPIIMLIMMHSTSTDDSMNQWPLNMMIYKSDISLHPSASRATPHIITQI